MPLVLSEHDNEFEAELTGELLDVLLLIENCLLIVGEATWRFAS